MALLCFNDAPRFGAHEEGGAEVCASTLFLFIYIYIYIYYFIISVLLYFLFYFILDLKNILLHFFNDTKLI
jgi:hypothetical protein